MAAFLRLFTDWCETFFIFNPFLKKLYLQLHSQLVNNTAIYENFLQFNKNTLDRYQEEPDFLITRRRGNFKVNFQDCGWNTQGINHKF